MQPLKDTLQQFAESISCEYQLQIDIASGKWQKSRVLKPKIDIHSGKRINTLENDLAIAHFFAKFLTYQEQSPKRITPGFTFTLAPDVEIQNVAQAIIPRLRMHLKNMSSTTFMTERIEKTIHKISRGVIAAQYHKIPQNTIHNPKGILSKLDETHRNWLTERFTIWVTNHFPPLEIDPRSSETSVFLEYACDFPEFIQVLQQDTSLLHQFFIFVFQNLKNLPKDAIDIFVQLPTTQRRISKARLDQKIGRYTSKGIKFTEVFQNEKLIKKHASILINTKPYSLSNIFKRVSLENGDERTLHDIFKIFQRQKDEIIDIEYTHNGIIKFDPKSINISFDRDDWYVQFPEFERLSKKDLEARYLQDKLLDSHALLIVKANRTTKNFAAAGTHAWCNLVFPIKENEYIVLAPGKFSDHFPPSDLSSLKNKLLNLLFVYRTQNAIIHPFDPNETNAEREVISIPFKITKVHLERALRYLKTAFREAHNKNLVFQTQGENCASFIHGLLQATFSEYTIPNMFEHHIKDLSIPSPLDHISRFIFSLPSKLLQKYAFLSFGTLFGAHRGITIIQNEKSVTKRLITHPHFQEGILNVPAKLFLTHEALVALYKRLESECRREVDSRDFL